MENEHIDYRKSTPNETLLINAQCSTAADSRAIRDYYAHSYSRRIPPTLEIYRAETGKVSHESKIRAGKGVVGGDISSNSCEGEKRRC